MRSFTRKSLCILLAFSVIVQFSLTSSAKSVSLQESSDEVSLSIMEKKKTPLKIDMINGKSTFTIPVQTVEEPAATIEDEPYAEEISVVKDSDVFYTKNISINKIITPDSSMRMKNRNTCNVFHFNGALANEGEYNMYGLVTLQPGEICQAQLNEAENELLDYDLMLYEVDANMNLITPAIDGSVFGEKHIVPESVGTVNHSNSTKKYAFVVLASIGGNLNSPYELTVSIAPTYNDLYETNENAGTATSLTMANLNPDQYYSFYATLSSPCDNDWYDIIVPSSPNFHSISIKYLQENNDLKMEMYRVENGVLDHRQNASGDTFPVQPGHNYLRIYPANPTDNFTETRYDLNIFENLDHVTTTHVTFETLMNGDDVPYQSYRMYDNYGEKRTALLGGATLTVKATYKDDSGRLISSGDMIIIDIYDKAWNPSAPSYHTGGYGEEKGGVCVAEANCPVPRGEGSGVSGMHFDYSASMRISTKLFGTLYNEDIFVTSRIM